MGAASLLAAASALLTLILGTILSPALAALASLAFLLRVLLLAESRSPQDGNNNGGQAYQTF